ncbi:type I restriction endonuclease subunit R, EcoR124 family [Corynebacterium pelargi]|uniref:Type I restriction enzyme endonuclease subunit n=1 Tax=Corynebacterium pelargi TaxID=1471400 RepID=A0A410WAP2_9CORY|nr:HsdR family type I site-specific deoxyribonuclease [Corynebacterium pelargi]QAU53004.1 Type-1 restriction enzyme R protein [Corynebacterium pelargi]GGG75499.1 DEAD/DEAH box helicase [Corynebacterium pelargi]
MGKLVRFASEGAFEDAVIEALTLRHGWSKHVLQYPSVADLVDNWARIIFKNNAESRRLNGVPLSEGEKAQLVEQIASLHTPADVQRFLQGMETTIVRDHPDDPEHQGKLISLKIFDPKEVAGGDSTYQIARQPVLPRSHQRDKDRRGDFMLLIWGIPVIHVELKNHGHDVSEATGQIHKYLQSGIFTGFFNAVQVFIGMTPTQMRYFARPAKTDHLTDMFHFTFADRNNEVYESWQEFVKHFISIPAAHTLVGDYLIADGGDGELKVLRPYQIHAVAAVEARMARINRVPLEERATHDHKGGYIWHTTGSGKTMTSFKTAMLMARDKIADKVIFVLDRIELGDQSEMEYRNFAGDQIDIARPNSTVELATELLKGTHRLVITSLHKLGKLTNPDEPYYARTDFERIQSQRIVFIVDEAHRSTFGEMYAGIRRCFPRAVFFGFTGTPIQEVNQKKHTQTSDLFGDELHRYSIYHGLRDGAVLRFDYQQVDIYPGTQMREKVALAKAEAQTIEGAQANSAKWRTYQRYMDPDQVPWVSRFDNAGKKVPGIEDLVPTSNWQEADYQQHVVDEILTNWQRRSQGGQLHAMFATSSIEEAIAYYRLFQAHNQKVRAAASDPAAPRPVLDRELKVTAVFSDADENVGNQQLRTDGIFEILDGYEEMFDLNFDRAELSDFKADVADRLAHKEGYKYITKDQMLDLVIVVDQLLTGYDSKFVGTLYLDKVLEYDKLVQAASRTNRIYDKLIKPQGTIVYYRKPRTMTHNFEAAFDLYAGGNAKAVFVDPLPANLEALNALFDVIDAIFRRSGIPDYSRLPNAVEDRKMFAVNFSQLAALVETCKVQGFTWEKLTYDGAKEGDEPVTVKLTEEVYEIWLARYRELGDGTPGNKDEQVPLDLTCLTYAQDAKRIDLEALDKKFDKWRKAIADNKTAQADLDALLVEVQQCYAALNQEEQHAARTVITMIQSGSLKVDKTKTFRDYINEQLATTQDRHIARLVEATGADGDIIREMLKTFGGQGVSEEVLKQFGRLDKVLGTVDYAVFSMWLSDERGLDLPLIDQKWAARRVMIEFFKHGAMNVANWDSSEFE